MTKLTRGVRGTERHDTQFEGLISPARTARRTTPAPVAIILALALLVVSASVSSNLLYDVFSIDAAPPILEDAIFFLCMFGLALGLLFLWVRLYERRGFGTLLGGTGRVVARISRGIVIGTALVAGTVTVLATTGSVSFEGPSQSATGIDALGGVLAGAVIIWAFPAAAEEIIARGWLLQSLAIRRGLVFAVAGSALSFAAWHWILDTSLGALPAANLVLAGIFWALYALKEGSVLGVCAAHTAYNWAETNLFGFDYYGEEPTGGSLLNLREAGPDILTGGGVGLNTTGGLAFSIVQILAIAVLLLLSRNKA